MKRVLSGALLIVVTVAVIGWGPRWLLFSTLAVLVVLALHEFLGLCERSGLYPNPWLSYLYGLWLLGDQWLRPQHFSFPALTAFVILVLAFSLRRPDRFTHAIGSSGATILGTLYVAGAMSLLLAWCPATTGINFHGSVWLSRAAIFLLLVIIWAADTGAFCVGKLWGKRKLAPRISPGKTVEGLWGGLVLSWLAALIFRHYVLREFGVIEVLVLVFVLNVAGLVGDLVESAMKRGAGVKDSSSIIPGHGGVLDRIDSLLFAIPVMYYYPMAVSLLKDIARAAAGAL